MLSEKLVSVCINAYNSQNTIRETLESVLNQTYTNLQVIVVDDCSTDKTADIVEEIASRDSRVELYRLPENRKISNANNEAISHAKGEYIAHLDSDDVWLPDKIEKQVAFLEENSGYGACFTHIVSIDETGTETNIDNSRFENVFNVPNMTQAEVIRYFYDNSNMLCHSSMLIRKSVQDEIGLHDLSMNMLHDFDLWVRLVHRYPFYIYQQPLLKYRVRKGSNSDMDGEKTVAHNEECARVIFNMINDCPDDLFTEAFSDRFRYEGRHEHTDIEIEKAFVLLDGFRPLKKNPVLGLKLFDELFQDKKTVRIAEKHFNFGLGDLYELHKNAIYFDHNLNDSLNAEIDNLNTEVDNSHKTIDTLNCEINESRETINSLNTELYESRVTVDYLQNTNREYKTQLRNSNDLNCQLSDHVNELNYKLVSTNNAYEAIVKSKLFWPVKPMFALKNLLHKIKSALFPRTYDGKKVKRKIMLYGFFGHNLGDDMFFDMLFKRYPDTLFYVLFSSDYRKVFEKYPNVRFYDVNRYIVKKIDAMHAKDSYMGFFEKLLLRLTDGAVHVGGSVYQQIADWQTDIEVRKRRVVKNKPFFGISNNFGPYISEDYKQFWADQFSKMSDVCFRDVYSYSMFPDIPNIRFAPDLLFTYTDKSSVMVEKRVAFSVINPRFRVRSFTEEQSQAYENKIKELIGYYVGKGYEISMLGFCELEEDRQEIEKIVDSLPASSAQKVRCVYYHDDYRQITDEIKRSEIIVATRFHAMVLGYIFGKKVIPVCYGSKMSHVINELGLAYETVTLEDIGKYSAEQIDAMAARVSGSRISEIRELAFNQFFALDKFVESAGGKVERL